MEGPRCGTIRSGNRGRNRVLQFPLTTLYFTGSNIWSCWLISRNIVVLLFFGRQDDSESWVTKWRDTLANWKDSWQIGKTIDYSERRLTMGKTRTSDRASYPHSDHTATKTQREPCSYDRPKGRENDRSNQSDNKDNGNGPDKDNDKEKYQCCGKQFDTERGLKIHQGKVCKRQEKV